VSTVPQELNWVEKRAACNIAEMFDKLCLEIQDDIIAINAVKYKEFYFKQDSLSDGSIVIGQPKRTPRVTVMIGIVEQKIMVQDQATPDRWSVSVGLNDEGRCVLKLEGGSELETWQFRKKALDALFFADWQLGR
jgi:hypothetical protein